MIESSYPFLSICFIHDYTFSIFYNNRIVSKFSLNMLVQSCIDYNCTLCLLCLHMKCSKKYPTDLFKQDFQTLHSPSSIHFPHANHCHSMVSFMIVSLTRSGAVRWWMEKGWSRWERSDSHITLSNSQSKYAFQARKIRGSMLCHLSDPSKWIQSCLWSKLNGSVFSKRLFIVNCSLECEGVLRCRYGFCRKKQKRAIRIDN